MKWQKEVAIPVKKAAAVAPEELTERIVTGVLVEREAPEYVTEYAKIRKAATEARRG